MHVRTQCIAFLWIAISRQKERGPYVAPANKRRLNGSVSTLECAQHMHLLSFIHPTQRGRARLVVVVSFDATILLLVVVAMMILVRIRILLVFKS